jgi:hypothetical protein
MTSIFLSHSSKDKFFVRELSDRLRSAGVNVWLDEAEIKIGDSLTTKIASAIETMQYFGVILSSNSISSEWVQKELQIAISRELEQKKVVILPILLEPVEIPSFLRDKLYADFTTPEKYEATFPKLLKSLGVDISSKIEAPIEEPLKIERQYRTNAEKRLLEFIDLEIVELDLNKTYKPDSDRALYNMYLRLSSIPPEEWAEIFIAERKFPRHTMWRRAWIEGTYIVINCVPEELEKYHMRDLLIDTKNSNQKFRQYITQLAEKEVMEKSRMNVQNDALKDIKRKLGL